MKLLSWKYPEEMPLKGTPFTIEEAEKLDSDIYWVTDGGVSFSHTPNVFHHRRSILEKLKDAKSYEERRYVNKMNLLDKLIPIYEKLCEDYPEE